MNMCILAKINHTFHVGIIPQMYTILMGSTKPLELQMLARDNKNTQKLAEISKACRRLQRLAKMLILGASLHSVLYWGGFILTVVKLYMDENNMKQSLHMK